MGQEDIVVSSYEKNEISYTSESISFTKQGAMFPVHECADATCPCFQCSKERVNKEEFDEIKKKVGDVKEWEGRIAGRRDAL